MELVSNIKNLFKTFSIPSKTITVAAHSKEKEWGLPLVRLGQGSSERDIYDISQTQLIDQEVNNA